MPKNNGSVIITSLSYLKSLISKGIVIANTNKNLEIKCKIKSVDNKMLFSIANNKVVLDAQASEIIKIFKKGIFLKRVG
ncbi:MAG: hypothetical protein HOD68_02575 [Flavobacteriales bacterium]|jgi:hypothetical protein|nr:hypothetical protein [Flavobacteriales bacterium]